MKDISPLDWWLRWCIAGCLGGIIVFVLLGALLDALGFPPENAMAGFIVTLAICWTIGIIGPRPPREEKK